jgi:hypothetical protein
MASETPSKSGSARRSAAGPPRESEVAPDLGIPLQGSKTPEERRRLLRGVIEAAVNRLADIVDEETAALRSHTPIDLKASNDRKSLGLIELNRVLRLMENTKPEPSTLKVLEMLNGKLETNGHFLKLHLEAVREVAAIISRTIREADSDGTYSPAFRSKGQTP